MKFDDLRKQGVRTGTMDLRIASIALSHDFTVFTRNTVDFGKVIGLRVEDWTTGT
jgi:tRNA(fMet)-specific endonuclease VapC